MTLFNSAELHDSHWLLSVNYKSKVRRDTITPTKSTPCVSLHRDHANQDVTSPGLLHSGAETPWTLGTPAVEGTGQGPQSSRSSPGTVFTPLCETKPNPVIIVDAVIWNVHITSTKGNVRTHCFSGAGVLEVAARVLVILKDDKNIGSLIETIRIFVFGPLPTYRRGLERFIRLFALTEWLSSWYNESALCE